MTIPRLYVPAPRIEEGSITIEGHDHHYLSRVLRMHGNQELRLLDGKGLTGRGRILEIDYEKTTVMVEEVERFEREIPRLHLYQALLAGAKMDRVAQDCTEAGAASMVPFSCNRSRKIDEAAGQRLNRWRRLSLEAWRLTGRPYRPDVADLLGWENLVSRLYDMAMVVFADESGGVRPAEALCEECCDDVALLIGPEGGFSDEERDELYSLGGKPVTLGSGIFRAETAGSALILAARCHYGYL